MNNKPLEGQITIDEYLEYLNSLPDEKDEGSKDEQETCR